MFNHPVISNFVDFLRGLWDFGPTGNLEPPPPKRRRTHPYEFHPDRPIGRCDLFNISDPGSSGLNWRSIHSSRTPSQSKENYRESQEEDCCIVAEIPKGLSQSQNRSKQQESSRFSGLPKTRFYQQLSRQYSNPDTFIEEKQSPSRIQDSSEDKVEVVKGDFYNSKSTRDSSRYPIFRTRRFDSLSSGKSLKTRKSRENELDRKIKQSYQSYRIQERLQYEKLLQMQTGMKRLGLQFGKASRKSVTPKPEVPVIDLTDEKSPVKINRTREEVPQTSSAKSSKNEIQILEEIPKVRSLKDMLKFNPVDPEEVIEEFLVRHSTKKPSSPKELALDEDGDDGQNAEGLDVAKPESYLDLLEERMQNYMRITGPTADEVTCCSVKEFSDRQQKKINSALVAHPGGQVLVEHDGLQITRRDMQTLKGLNWLNDEVINFYMQLIMDRSKRKSSLPKVYAFNTFFYPKLMNGGHSGLKRWTKKVDIFSFDLILIPVHLGMHWCMAVIDFRTKEVRYYDSMGSPNDRCLQFLLFYLEAESCDKKNKKFDTSSWEQINAENIPQQMNGSDCGVFSCMFAEHLSRNVEIDFTQENMPYFRRQMVLEILEAKLLN